MCIRDSDHAVDPAAELEAHRAQRADAKKAGRGVQADRGGVGAVADHRDDLPVAETLATADELSEQQLADALALHPGPHVDRILQAVAVGRARAVQGTVAVARDVVAVLRDDPRQAAAGPVSYT